MPHLPGTAGFAAGGQRGRRPVRRDDRPGAELLGRVVVPLRAQELLLPGHAEELPDQPVRRTAVRERLARRGGRREDPPNRDHPRPHGGGHRQVPARRRVHRAHSRGDALPRRLQPGRHPPHRDRHRAGRPFAGGRPCLRRRTAGAVPGSRRFRRADGTGLVALRRQRVVAAADRSRGARGTLRHPVGDQEPQLAAVGRTGGPLRDRPAGHPVERGPSDRPGDQALR